MSGPFFTVQSWHGRLTYALWTDNPLTNGPSTEKFLELWDFSDINFGYEDHFLFYAGQRHGRGESLGVKLPIPDKRKQQP